ncbi:7654_t:CDS:10 [Dentiscutata erythropus]|uniref:7654_t:CDS:1 n=1 Tax=Dentiscutata erythropus TaxID=1348616 RepID=A0A9N9A0B7_9GLOM|nr:7654_t:CDS:10 [Dentiscutata erythropus]
MSSATMRSKGGRRDGYQSFNPNSNQSHNNRSSKNKWNTNSQHLVNNTPRNQQIPPTTQPSSNHHNNTPSSGSNSLKTIEQQVVHDEVAAKHMHDRILFLLANFVGINVIVTVKSGIKYQGLLSRACTESELGVVLKCARKVLSKQDEKAIPNGINEFIILAKDLMEIYATGVDFSLSEKTSSEREGFRIDADISGRTDIRERELHKWTPDESGEAMKESANASWDQFAVNEQLFGLTTDYNEEIYTTKLDRSKADYKERERKAINLANEITRESTTNVHMLEERGHIVEDQMDEEERYGAVVRNRDPSKYTPPHLRKQQEQPIQPNGVASAVKKVEQNNEVAKDTKVKPPEDPKPKTKPAQPTTIPASPTSSIPKSTSSLSNYRIPEHVMASLQFPRKIGSEAEGKPIEAQIVKTFRQFATNEKERLQQRKQAIFKKEMDGKMAELLKWEFVKPSIKIEEVQLQKSNGESKTNSEKVISEKPTSAADKAPPQFPSNRAPVTTQTNTQYKLNVKAPEWKPNPNAASFTPTPNSSTGDKRSPGSSPFFGNRQLKKNFLSLKDGFSPFQKSKSLPNPSTIPPTWPFGQRPFRHHFSVTNNYEEDIYSQAAANQSFGFAAYPVAAPYRYPSGQFVGVPPMPLQQATPMPYLPQGFVPGIPFTAAAPLPPTGAPPTIYSPQISSMIPQHFGSQGFQSPGRTPIVPAGIHPQIYQPYQNQHGIPMMRYPHDMRST